MRMKIQNVIYSLRQSFWLIPALMTGAAILLSFMTIGIDHLALRRHDGQLWWFYSGGPDGARTILSVIAGSMITIAGVVFSITIVVLSLASTQFGPRLIRNFMNVRANQMVLGTFVATFTYGIIVLRTVNATVEQYFVPNFSVMVAIIMSLLSLGVMIFFIHSIAESIQAQHILARIRSDLESAVDRLFPEKLDHEQDLPQTSVRREYRTPIGSDRDTCPVKAMRSGYLRSTDYDALMGIALENSLIIHVAYRPGDFITRGSTLVTVRPGRLVDESLSKKINAIFIMGPERTLEQDVEFAISQLVEVAVRALSPGINDPITAITCIDWLGAALCQMANRKLSASHVYDEKHQLRLICKPFSYEGMVNAAFNMIRQNSQSVPAVSIHLLETIATIAAQVRRKEDISALMRQADMVVRGCAARLSAGDDRKDLERRYDTLVNSFDRKNTGPEERA